ncbi:cobyric acid synthase [Colwellia sp. 12G3]|uniref:cobyric acid synthase n=1 Tax=Colwellia sp. 12G3 TaxID=2058299 RepID=UPI000C333D0B|nr:cobyric acid synthase [Colwellia sp. 12G3]PKI17022.1 cobyric acid synthase CobQ [Colwellia sp. 12G3]
MEAKQSHIDSTQEPFEQGKVRQCKTLMIQGTTSDAGKTTLVAGLCRVFADLHIKVAPFKPQNMALNSAVTPCGGEIGRAQALQAKAARLALDVDFNPILLKPNSDTGAQVIVHGKALKHNTSSNMEASEYQDYKKVAMQAVLSSHERLMQQYDLIVVEGAGSPAEINLREGDIANMGFAEAVDCPVLIIADIDKGGVFAQLVGTLMLLSQSEQDRVVGFVINRFRGDIKLLESGLTWLEEKTNKPVLGVLPYLHGLDISSEDALVTQQTSVEGTSTSGKVRIVVLVYPHMSNHTDFDALRHHEDIDCQFLFAKGSEGESNHEKITIPACDLIILPGSKNVRSDLKFLRQRGWHDGIAKHLRYQGKVIGICGGYQMLGELIDDPEGLEGQTGMSEGLGYFAMKTILKAEKTLINVSGILQLAQQSAEIKGYEIHAGQSTFNDTGTKSSNLLNIQGEGQGLLSDDGQIAGCYLHGLFDQPAALQLFMHWLGHDVSKGPSVEELEEKAIERVSKACQKYLAMDKIKQIVTEWYN